MHFSSLIKWKLNVKMWSQLIFCNGKNKITQHKIRSGNISFTHLWKIIQTEHSELAIYSVFFNDILVWCALHSFSADWFRFFDLFDELKKKSTTNTHSAHSHEPMTNKLKTTTLGMIHLKTKSSILIHLTLSNFILSLVISTTSSFEKTYSINLIFSSRVGALSQISHSMAENWGIITGFRAD